MPRKYILEGKKVVAVSNLLEWARWIEEAGDKRIVAKDFLEFSNKTIEVSTVFLGVDHRFDNNRVPIVFETMIFGGEFDENMERYSTWQDAVQGHQRWIEKVKVNMSKKQKGK